MKYSGLPIEFHRTCRILVWDPQGVFEHKWRIERHILQPTGDTESIVRLELEGDSNNKTNDTAVILTHSRLRKDNGMRFAPGWRAVLDRLAAQLDGKQIARLGGTHHFVQRALDCTIRSKRTG